MTKKIGRNINTNDTATLSSAISLNATTSTIVISANARRIGLTISNESSKQIWLKFQTAATDDDKKGIVLFARSIYEMIPDNIYTGEISAIAESGTPEIFITEY